MHADEPGKDSKQVHQPHDTAYRFLLDSKKLLLELLRSFVDKGWVREVDESNVQRVPRSFILPDFRKQEADLVYQVKVNGQEVLLYLLLELQSTVDFLMPYRLLLYQVSIWRYWMDEQDSEAKERKTFRLPPIVPLVLYNGDGPWTASLRFRDKIAREEMFGSQLIDFEYLLIDVVRYREEDLLALSNTIGSVFLLDQTRDKDDLYQRLNRLLGTIRRLPEDNQHKFLAWMGHILADKLPDGRERIDEFIRSVKEGETVMSLEQTLDAIRREGLMEGKLEGRLEGKLEGILEGKLEGKLEAKEEVAKRLIGMGLEPAAIAEATDLPLDKIEQLRKQIH